LTDIWEWEWYMILNSLLFWSIHTLPCYSHDLKVILWYLNLPLFQVNDYDSDNYRICKRRLWSNYHDNKWIRILESFFISLSPSHHFTYYLSWQSHMIINILIFDMHIVIKMISRYYHSIITKISIKYHNINNQTSDILSRYFDKSPSCT